MVYPYNGILFANKTEWSADAYILQCRLTLKPLRWVKDDNRNDSI